MVQAMEAKYGRPNRIWVMDGGLVSEDNLRFRRKRGGSYLVGTPKAMLRRFEQHLSEQNGHEVQAGAEVKRVPGPDGEVPQETFILARSAERRAQEHAMHRRFLERREAGLMRWQAAIETGRLKDEGLAQRRLGRLQERNGRAAGAFQVHIRRRARAQGKVRLTMTWTRRPRRGPMGGDVGGVLSAEDQSDRHRSGHAVEAVHPAPRGPVGLPHREERAGATADLASPTPAGEGPHPGVLPGLCAVEGLGSVDAPGGVGRCPTNLGGGMGQDQERGRGPAGPWN
jgi:hypothetical protein